MGRLGLILAVLSVAVTAAYSSVVLSHYAYADDFMTLYEVRSPSLRNKIAPFYNAQGRPLGGVIVEAAFCAAWTLAGLGKIRAVCLVLTLLCGALLAAEFRRVAPWWVGLAAVSLLLLNPAMAVFVAWANSGLLSLPATVLALLGGMVWRRAFGRGGACDWRFWLHVVGGATLALAALLIYQPCACFFLLPAAIRLLDKEDPPGALRAAAWTAAGFALVCAGYFAAFQIVRPHLARAEDTVIYRADTVRDVAGRLWFYVTDVLPRSFDSWTVFFGTIPEAVALGGAGLLTLPFLLRLVRTPGGTATRWQSRLVVPVLFALASSPLLVVKDNYAPFRTLAALYGLVTVGLAAGVQEIAGWVPSNRRAAVAAAWLGLAVANGAAAAYVTEEGFVRRSVRELDAYRRFVRQQPPDTLREVIVLLPYAREVPAFSRIAPAHEFGTASSSQDWNFPGLPYFALDDEHCTGAVVHKIPTDRPELFPANVPVIEVARVLRGSAPGEEVPRSGPVTTDGFFGDVQPLTPTLRWSCWFGLHEVLSPTSVRHREFGLLDLSGQGGSDCWFYHAGFGWFWTNPQTFPFVLDGDRKHWLWYVRGSRRPAEFFDFDAPGHPRIVLEP